MYRDGILPTGEAMTAIVAGDVPVTGSQFSCAGCHGRSGMGTGEGQYIVPPVAGPFLFTDSPQPPRPAYSAESLATVLREGMTPGGRRLNESLMPRYLLEDTDVTALAAYLETLSSSNSPGVDAETIRFATIITEGVDSVDREALLGVINLFSAEINRQTRNDSARWDRGYTPESRLPTVFREWVIDEWVLSGPREGWAAQLDTYYAEAPVFAVLSGLGRWDTVGQFCERESLPCLFPVTDLADTDDGNFYSFYFSRGLALEADLIAAHVAAEPPQRLVQVFCDRSLQSVVEGLSRSAAAANLKTNDLEFDCGQAFPATQLDLLLDNQTATVLWLNHSQFPAFAPSGRLYLSSTMLGRELPEGAFDVAQPVFLVHPYRLPGGVDPAMRRFTLWAKTRGIEIDRPGIQAGAFFASVAVNDALKHMSRFYIRDYMLDMLDHTQGLAAYVPDYPRPTFGPGQRFLSKGGYVLPVVDGKLVVDGAEWIIP